MSLLPASSFARLRIQTLITAISTLTLNILASLLFAQIPDEAYHLASNFRWYLQLANFFALVGLVGGVRQSPFAISLFSTTLLLDAIFLLIPRLLTLLVFLQPTPQTICPPSLPYIDTYFAHIPQQNSPQHQSQLPYSAASYPHTLLRRIQFLFQTWTETWTPRGCERVVYWVQITLLAGVVAAVILQIRGGVCARKYVKELERREEAVLDDCGKNEVADNKANVIGKKFGRCSNMTKEEV